MSDDERTRMVREIMERFEGLSEDGQERFLRLMDSIMPDEPSSWSPDIAGRLVRL